MGSLYQLIPERKFLQIIFFSIFFDFGLSSLGEKSHPLLKIFEIANEIMIKITAAVMYLAPYGVAALIAYTIGKSGASVLLPLIKLIILMYIASVIHVCIVYLPLMFRRYVASVFFSKHVLESLNKII